MIHFVLIAATFAMSEAPKPVIVAATMPQSAPIYATAKACAVAGELYRSISGAYLSSAANILGAPVQHSVYVVGLCEPAARDAAPGATLQYNLTTGIGNLAAGSNGNMLSIIAQLASPADCTKAKSDLVTAMAPMAKLLDPHMGGAFCY
jgi:hypothetical protein